jgi:light-regulated signal transduction histidine kinase (bacteriophytochrome)
MLKDLNQLTQDLEDSDDLRSLSAKYKSLLKSREKEITTIKAEIEKHNQNLNDFIYASAHALKSPVANLNLIAILLEKSNDIDEIKSYLETIKSSVKRLDQTIHGMVHGFQVQKTEHDPVCKIDFKDLINRVRPLCVKECGFVQYKILEDFKECPEVVYPLNNLTEILSILINNSIKYRSEDRELQISISSKKINNLVTLEIEDNGIGIDLSKYGKDLFQPFKKFSSRMEGAGLGLYLAKILISKNNGNIEIESQLNQGTLVKCYLREMEIKI